VDLSCDDPLADRLIGKRLVSPAASSARARRRCSTPCRASIQSVSTRPSAKQVPRFARRSKAGAGVRLILADGSVHPYKGKLVIVDRAVDQKTGTLTFSAEFPNPDGRLRPGQFGRIRAVVATAKDAIVVPKRAVQEIQGMQTVLVVGADNAVALRTIRPVRRWRPADVRNGLKPGERVIVDGIQKARPGSKVNPTAAPPRDARAGPTPCRRASCREGRGK
jgi:RND family efflux transporter MFP subunit